MAEFEISSEATGFPIRALPGATRWVRQGVVWLFAGGLCVSAWLKKWVPFLVALPACLALHVFIPYAVFCPQCKRALMSRMQGEGQGRRRAYYDCPDCKITWESEIVEEDD